MGIPESQLETWSHQGSVTQSSSTYQSVKAALESSNAPYAGKDFQVFLQGSYGNDTNIYAESDVDIVIRLDSAFSRDLTQLSSAEQSLYNSSLSNATYNLTNFRNDVVGGLQKEYGSDLLVGEKAIQLAPRGGRRKTDIIICIQYRKYHSFQGLNNQRYTEGIKFDTLNGVEIINYPKMHSENLTKKHQATNSYFKPMTRIFKNIRSKMVDYRFIDKGIAPSYYVEGMLYNVPITVFGGSLEVCTSRIIEWLMNNDKSQFVCANEQFYLCHPSSPVTWRAEQMNSFIAGTVNLWKSW